MAYEHLFFDWDHTLWDFETNSRQVLNNIFYEYNLRQFGILSPEHFMDVYMPINYRMWKMFREGEIDTQTVKYKRFEETFTLTELKGQFQMHVVTNGFLEVTEHKIKHSDIGSFFQTILSAEEVGVLKPNPAVFYEAFKRSGATAENSLFIGDNLIADVQGAQSVGMHQVYFNPEKEAHNETPTFEISDMKELVTLLQ